MEAELDVGVVGCGFAGCATALFLARAGHRVTIYERVADPTSIGAGILLQPTGLAVLAELGLREQLLARAARVDGLRCQTARGKCLFDLRYAELATDTFGAGTHRGSLFELLYGAVAAAGIRVRAGIDVTRAVSQPERAVLHDASGPIAEHDLIVVADGARSRLRADSPLLSRAKPYAWGALWFVGSDPERRFGQTLAQYCDGTERMIGFLPTGLGPGREQTPLVSFFYSLRMDRLDAWRRAGLGPWKQEIARLAPVAMPLVEQIEDVEQVLTAGYVDAVMRRLHDGRIVFVGDAAHAMSPQLGQGTNLALIDAQMLARALQEAPDPAAALALFSARRRAHVRFYQFASRWLTPFFQSDRRWLAGLRDVVFPVAGRSSPLRGQMLRVLAGLKRGLLRRSLELSA